MTKISPYPMMFLLLIGCGQQSAEDVFEDSQNCSRFQIELEAITPSVQRGELGQIVIHVVNRATDFNDFVEPTFILRGVPIDQYLESWEFSLPQITPNSNDATLLDFTVSDSAPIGFVTFDITTKSINDESIACTNDIVIAIE